MSYGLSPGNPSGAIIDCAKATRLIEFSIKQWNVTTGFAAKNAVHSAVRRKREADTLASELE
jgi:hypothetical protein